jgi:hypothetical protein
MSDKKLSELPAGTAIQVTDLFYSGQDAGGGIYTSVKQPWSAMLSAVGAGGAVTILTPVTGFSVTIPDTTSSLVLDPAGMLASGTITMPAVPVINRVDIRATQPVSNITLSPNTGQTIKAAPITLAAGQRLDAIYDTGTATWYFGS